MRNLFTGRLLMVSSVPMASGVAGRRARGVMCVLALGCVMGGIAQAQVPGSRVDSDGDGLSDALEQTLLDKFVPEVMVSGQDCSAMPGELLTNTATPYVLADNGTLYGQATLLEEKGRGALKAAAVSSASSAAAFTPSAAASSATAGASSVVALGSLRGRRIELHYYFLWRTDCGRLGHALDAEHVSVLLTGGTGDSAEGWRAVYWYAAAHEDTACDASQLTRASALGAEDHGARVWLSYGKHGSFLNHELCRKGCGGDRCESMKRMAVRSVINVGEPNALMNGAIWAKSSQWPLLEKMQRSDFSAARVERLEALPESDVAWAEPSKRPVQAAIRGGNAGVDGTLVGANSTANALSLSDRQTNTALVLANNKTGAALDTAAHSTGKALGKSANSVRDAAGSAWRHTGGALKKDSSETD
ncbi:MAG: hypothetical protein PW789_04650 [Edaphobacter sp.]|uniref:hypothetical protein n=1 Tax=Edaphobacter sp. TaxID=1934404 RepID=UPI00239A8A33|nr:hypothetical protein [Edaphobacter sp.]MDE1175876.1 hypothetical protein [Edaphobacter sp.]